MFVDRLDAGRKLAAALEKFRDARPLVLGLARGGLVIGAEIAQALGCDLDVALVKKLRAPDNPELAIGAVGEEGTPYINADVQQMTRAGAGYMQDEIQERVAELAGQRDLYRSVRPRVAPTDRTVILVDDGLATGATMIAAIQTTALTKPARLVVAVPVAPPEIVGQIGNMREVAEVVCLAAPQWFEGVGQFYRDFTQVTDAEVLAILRRFA